MKTLTTATCAALALLLAPTAFAQTLYKLVDKDGKVTYSETAPKNFAGTVTKIEIDQRANRMAAPTKGGEATFEDVRQKREAGAAAAKDNAAVARTRLDAARKAYEQARDNPAEADVRRVGTVGGGTRPVFSDDYQARLDKLEAAVREAEEALRRAERG